MTQSSIPGQAQEVPDQPVATVYVGFNKLEICWHDQLRDGEHKLFTRPTPAAADLPDPLKNMDLTQPWTEEHCRNYPRAAAALINRLSAQGCELVAASPAAAAVEVPELAEALSSIDALIRCYVPHNRGTDKQAGLNALALIRAAFSTPNSASPAAAAEPSVKPYKHTDYAMHMGREVIERALHGGWKWDDYKDALTFLLDAASPVAPVGAPTLSDEREALRELVEADKAHNIAQGTDDGAVRWEAIQRLSAAYKRARALLSRPGCELATDATKQLGEHSVHLAATPIDQDFRDGTALSDTARLNWLERQTVEVRVAQRHGSRRAIYEIASWDEEQDEPAPSGLRAAIDAEMKE